MNKLLYFFIRVIAWPVVNICILPKIIQNKQNLKINSKCIVVSNHTSYWDPIVIGHLVRPRNTQFMAKVELIKNPVIKKFLLGMGIVPVSRGKGDLKAVKSAIKVLKDEGVLGVFPEGTRSKTGEILPFISGVAIIALKTDTPILPIYLHDNGKPFKKRVKVVVGEPFKIQDIIGEEKTSASIDEANNVLRNKICELKEIIING